jgi:Ca2+/H+ antiporter, TMEM165/GDT1 family
MIEQFLNSVGPSLLTCTLVVALAEMGDKTQLLSLMLAARFKQFWPIVLGITVATLLNHGLAAALGSTIQQWIPRHLFPWVLAISFIAIGLWLLKPDQLDETPLADKGRLGVFGITVVAFFLAEIGDKTQIATIALAARYESILVVTLGTTFGMLLANAPAVYLGQRFAQKLPVKLLNRIAAVLFVATGLWIAFFGQQAA